MYHPTPYHWTTGDGLTHVFYDNHLPPNSGFGWSSLCNAVQLPIEGKHFELNQHPADGDITCQVCRERLNAPHFDLNDDTIAEVNGCLVRYRRNEEDVLIHCKRVCRNMLHHSLSFEPDSFTGDLEEQVEEICSKCWETYVDHQWTESDEGAELRVEVARDNSRTEYFAKSTEAMRSGSDVVLKLVSGNGLEKDIPRREIQSIQLTPSRDIVY